jgi:hypothetical protein
MRTHQLLLQQMGRIFLILLTGVAVARAQDVGTITMKDGTVYSSSSIRGSSNTIFISIPTTQGSGFIEIGLPFSKIASLNIPAPSDLRIAIAAAKAGDAETVILRTKTNIDSEADLKDVPGSWWPEIAKIRLFALASSGRYADAADLAGKIGVLTNETATTLSRGGTLFGSVASSDTEAVVVGANAIPRLSGEPGAALAQLALGQALLMKKDYPGALRAFLTIKVFYPSLTLLQPAALMGAANAYLGLDDEKRALQAVIELQDNFARSPQAPDAKKMEKHLSKS